MNFFWVSDKLSWIRYLTLSSFCHHNPDWAVKLWTSLDTSQGVKTWPSGENQDSDVYQGVDYTSKLRDLPIEMCVWNPPLDNLAPAHASDLFQWEMLGCQGGFYSDMDILYIRPMPKEIIESGLVYCLSKGYMSIGFFGSAENNPVFHAVYAEALGSYMPEHYQNTGAEAVYRLGGVGNCWRDTRFPGTVAMDKLRADFPTVHFQELPQQVIYPWAWNRLDGLWSVEGEAPRDCIGIHWFGGAPLSQTMNSKLTEDNMEQFPCTFTRYAKEFK